METRLNAFQQAAVFHAILQNMQYTIFELRFSSREQ